MGFCKVVIIALSWLGIIPLANAVPQRGDIAWTMLLCKYKDTDLIPHDRDWYVKWMTDDTVDGSIAYFFHKASNGIYNIGRSQVHGWFEIPFSKQETLDLANHDAQIRVSRIRA